MDRFNLNVFRYNQMPWSQPANWVPNIAAFFRSIKYAWQRAIKGYCDYDLWSFDGFLTSEIVNGLKGFVDQPLHGAPYQYFDVENDSIQPWVDKVNGVREKFEGAYIDECIIEVDEEKFREAWNALGEIYHGLWD